MKEINLIESSGHPVIDRVLCGVVGLCELVFPGRIRGYYLQGSYAAGDATPDSDIDATLLFKGEFTNEAERQTAGQIDPILELLVGRQLDILPASEASLKSGSLQEAAALMHLKNGSRLIFGQDVRAELPAPDWAAYVRCCMQSAFRAVSWHHHHPRPLRLPLGYPDPSGEFYGYNQSRHTVGEPPAPSTERLVYSVVRIAGALAAAKRGVATYSKLSCVRAYAAEVGGEWAKFVAEVLRLCHDEWHSRVPSGPAERDRLRDLYAQALGFENHFLEDYHRRLTGDLDSADAAFRQSALEMLELISG
jgi:predicted nucleotidyltransferase